MDPDGPRRKCFNFGREGAESFAKSPEVFAGLESTKKEIGRREEDADGDEQAVEKIHSVVMISPS